MTRARDKANLTQKITTSEPTQLTDGMIWLDTDAVAVSQQSMRWTKTPSGGTTVLSGASDTSITLSYSTGQEQVYANGVLLIRGSDYTASDGTSITLASASVAGDVFEVISIIPLTLVDTYTQTQANSAFIPKTLTTTTGDLIYAASANTPARLGIGSTSQVLTVAGGVPSWATPAAGGGMTLLASGSLTGGSVNLSSISQSYKSLVVFIRGASMSNNDEMAFTVNSLSSAYQFYLNTNGTVLSATSFGGYGQQKLHTGNSLASNSDAHFAITFPDYTSTTGLQIYNWNGYIKLLTGTADAYSYGFGVANTTSAITSIQLTANYGGAYTWDSGTYSLYGVS